MVVFCGLVSCKPEPRRVVFKIPDNFQGIILIHKKPTGENRLAGKKGELKILVPESGVVVTDEYDVFKSWHQTTAESKNDSDNEFFLFSMGEVNNEYMVYFYGDADIHKDKVKKIPVFDLKPGRFP
jgi:hypothetical protein